MTMDQETKGRLREAALKKRQANPRAKDYAVEEWLILLDQAKDELAREGVKPDQYDPQPGWEKPEPGWEKSLRTVGVTLKYVPDAVIDALAKVLHGVRVSYQYGPGRFRVTWVLPQRLTCRLLKVMRLEPDDKPPKYFRRWDADSIRRCKAPGS